MEIQWVSSEHLFKCLKSVIYLCVFVLVGSMKYDYTLSQDVHSSCCKLLALSQVLLRGMGALFWYTVCFLTLLCCTNTTVPHGDKYLCSPTFLEVVVVYF